MHMTIDKIGVYGGIEASRVFHEHAHYEFRYIAAGECVFESRGRKYPLGAGDFTFAYPHERHRIVYGSGMVTQYIIAVTPGDDAALEERLRTLRAPSRKYPAGEQRFFFETIRRKVSSGSSDLKRSGVYQFLSFIYSIGTRVPAVGSVENVHVEKALAVMQKSLAAPVRLTDISREIGLDHSHFIRLFKRFTGIPPMKYVTRLRVETAANLLAETPMPVHEIASRMQFPDQFQFSRVFKRWMGLSPLQYRSRSGHLRASQ